MELILDLHDCQELPTTRIDLAKFFKDLCDNIIFMEREDLHFWDYDVDQEGYDEAEDHLKGISAVQFIKTSNITIHTIDVSKKVYINIFSCKAFAGRVAANFAAQWFRGTVENYTLLDRK